MEEVEQARLAIFRKNISDADGIRWRDTPSMADFVSAFESAVRTDAVAPYVEAIRAVGLKFDEHEAASRYNGHECDDHCLGQMGAASEWFAFTAALGDLRALAEPESDAGKGHGDG